MLKLNIAGKFKGVDACRDDANKRYIYVEPVAPLPPSLLEMHRVLNPEMGEVTDMRERLGTLAILQNSDQPDGFNLDELITLSALCWPTVYPRWGERDNDFRYDPENVRFPCHLYGEVKRGGDRKAPAIQIEVTGTAKYKRFHGEKEAAVRLELDTSYPEEFISPVKVYCEMRGPRGFKVKSYRDAPRRAGMFTVRMSLPESHKVNVGESVTVRGELWPVSVPYFSEKEKRGLYSVIPELRMFGKSVELSVDKGKPARAAAGQA